jgi:hypothetical protein
MIVAAYFLSAGLPHLDNNSKFISSSVIKPIVKPENVSVCKLIPCSAILPAKTPPRIRRITTNIILKKKFEGSSSKLRITFAKKSPSALTHAKNNSSAAKKRVEIDFINSIMAGIDFVLD